MTEGGCEGAGLRWEVLLVLCAGAVLVLMKRTAATRRPSVVAVAVAKGADVLRTS